MPSLSWWPEARDSFTSFPFPTPLYPPLSKSPLHSSMDISGPFFYLKKKKSSFCFLQVGISVTSESSPGIYRALIGTSWPASSRQMEEGQLMCFQWINNKHLLPALCVLWMSMPATEKDMGRDWGRKELVQGPERARATEWTCQNPLFHTPVHNDTSSPVVTHPIPPTTVSKVHQGPGGWTEGTKV